MHVYISLCAENMDYRRFICAIMICQINVHIIWVYNMCDLTSDTRLMLCRYYLHVCMYYTLTFIYGRLCYYMFIVLLIQKRRIKYHTVETDCSTVTHFFWQSKLLTTFFLILRFLISQVFKQRGYILLLQHNCDPN